MTEVSVETCFTNLRVLSFFLNFDLPAVFKIIYFHNNELDNNIYIFKSLLLCLWILKLCLANTCKLKMVM